MTVVQGNTSQLKLITIHFERLLADIAHRGQARIQIQRADMFVAPPAPDLMQVLGQDKQPRSFSDKGGLEIRRAGQFFEP